MRVAFELNMDTPLNNSFSFDFTTFIGPLYPRGFYEASLKRAKQAFEKALEAYNYKNRLFVAQVESDRLASLAKIWELRRLAVAAVIKREACYNMHYKLHFYALPKPVYRLPPIPRLPPLSVFNTKNPYQSCSVSECEMESAHIEYCYGCGSEGLMFISEPNMCLECAIADGSRKIKEVEMKPLKTSFKLSTARQYKGQFYDSTVQNLNKLTKNLKYKISELNRSPLLEAKIKSNLTVFALYRQNFKNRLIYFANFSQFSYADIKGRDSIRLMQNAIYNQNLIKDPYLDFTSQDFSDMCAEDALKLEEIPFISEEDVNAMLEYDDFIECQMEEPHGDCEQLEQEQKGNVILTTHADESVAEPINLGFDSWEQLCSPQKIQVYTQLMGRWQNFANVEWTGSNKQNDSLGNWSLFDDFIKKQINSPNCILFKQYAYFRSDIEIKIVVNTNKFHCGALQASFYYGASMDKHYKDRENVFSASQLTHCIIDAATASDGILKIPYRYYKPLMGTFDSSDDQTMKMGFLRLLVLNDLKIPAGNYNSVQVNLFMRFVNPSFHGMKPRDLIENQMMGMAALVKETANLVNQVFPDPQRDNPTDVIPPKPMVPWSAHSWCIGDICPEPSNVLRIQATGNTPHPPGTLPKEPEMDIKYVSRIFGLTSTIIWKNDQVRGSILATIPFSPIWSFSDYFKVNIDNGEARSCSVLPPVSIIAELFAYWRGSMEYRLDFISTMFHTGRLIIAYLPRYKRTTPTIDQLTSCDHVILDLRDERQVVYTNSYLSDKPWWPRRKMGIHSTETLPPGYIYIAVLNPLCTTSTVSSEININLYMRAGDDMEFHIPVNPQIGLSFNTSVTENSVNFITYDSNYGPPYTGMYVDTWHSVNNRLVLRYGPTSDHIIQFNNIGDRYKECNIYMLSQPSEVVIPHPHFSAGLQYLVLFKMASDEAYIYGAPFVSRAAALSFSTSLKLGIPGVVDELAIANMSQSGGASGGAYVPQTYTYYWGLSANLVVADGDERKEVCGEDVQVQNRVNSTNNGFITFGEKITSLKQILRRYAPYALYVSNTKANSDPSLADFGVPLLPQGLDLDLKTAKNKEHIYANRVRDGPLAIIASGYRFYRGSIRLRFIVTGSEEGCFWVQHRPEYNLRSTKVFIPDKNYVDAYYQPGYATMIQMTSMNNIVEIEVPFYLPGQFGLLQRPDLSRIEDAVHYSLGTLYCGFDTMKGQPKEVPYYCQIFNSMGDDMSFSVFQGFPPVFDLSQFNRNSSTIEAQGLGDYLSNKLVSSVSKSVQEEVTKLLSKPEELTEAGTSDGTVTESKDYNAVIKSDVDTSSILDLIKAHIVDLSSEKQQVIIAIVSQLIHSMINPSVTQICWSIASIFVHMGVIAMNMLDKFIKILNQFISKFNFLSKLRAKKSDSAANVVVADADTELDPSGSGLHVEAAFVSTCVTGMLAMVGACNKPLPTSLPNFASYLYSDLPKFTLTANGLFIFLKNNLLMFKNIWYWLVSYFNHDYIIYKELSGATGDVLKFVRKVQWCLDGRNKTQVKTDPKASLQVYEMANVASSYLAKRAISKIAKSMPVFESYCRKIIALRDELTQLMICPAIRFEPFVISLVGPPNVGKSHLAQTLSRELLASINYKSYEELVYTRTPGNAYWNGLRNQAICLFDDFLNLVDPQFALIQIGELFCLKSKAVFNPPMAAIEEKQLRYNPLIVFLLSNEAFPKIQGVASDTAWMRRRDIMFHCQKKKEYLNKHPRSLKSEESKIYKHLEFNRYNDPSGFDRTLCPDKKEYGELLATLVKEFGSYFEQECIQYDRAIAQVRDFYPSYELGTDEYVKAIEERINIVNSDASRVVPSDFAIIQEYLKKLHEEKYSADMTNFVRRTIVDNKVKLIEQEAEKQKRASALPEPLIPIVADGPEEELEESMQVYLTSNLGRARAGLRTMIKDLIETAKVTNECCDCCEVLLNQSFEIKHDIELKSLYLQTCPSGAQRFLPPVQLYLEGPEERTPCIRKNIAVRDMINQIALNEFRDVADQYLPYDLVDLRHRVKAYIKKKGAKELVISEKVKFMSTEEVDNVILDEVANEAWYARLWAKVPSWGTILHWLCKISAIVASIGIFIRLIGYCVASPFSAKAGCDKAAGDAALAGAYRTFAEDVSHSYISEEQGSKYSVGTVGGKAANPVVAKVLSQASEQQTEVMLSKIIRNTFWLLAEYDEGNTRVRKSFRCFGLVGHKYILLDHYIYYLETRKNLKLFYVRDGANLLVPNSILNCTKLKDSAICVGTLDIRVPAFPNIVKFFVKSNQTKNLPPQAALFEYKYNDEKDRFIMNVREFDRVYRRDRVDVTNDDGSSTVVSSLYSYPYGGRGVCGSVLVSNSNIPNPILGIHIAGKRDNSEGYAEAIVYESFASLIGLEPEVVANSAYPCISILEPPIMALDGNILQLGSIPRNCAVYPPNKSRIIPSECAGAITSVTYDLPVLSAKDERIKDAPFSPLLEGCKYHTIPCTNMPDEFVERAAEDVKDMLLAYVKPCREEVGTLTYEQSVCGLMGNPLYEAMPMDTSEGFPWILDRPAGASNKSWMFKRTLTNDGWTLDSINEKLLVCMNEKDVQRRNGMFYESVFVDCLKDAKLPKEKVLLPGKTRIFSVSPVDFTIQQRQYSMDFSVAYQQARMKTEHAVGIDIYSIEANNLVESMLEFSPKLICGDYSKFGDQLYAKLVQKVYDIIAAWYMYNSCTDDKLPIVLRSFGYEVSYATHLMLNQLYRSFGGMPSGNPLTVIINSCVNSMYIRVVWQKIMITNSLLLIDMKSFRDNVKMVTYGDDIMMAVKDDVIEQFNGVTIAQAFQDYNIKFTNAVKSGAMLPFTSIHDPETTFLKCTFHKHEKRANLWVARMERRVVEETCNWTWNTHKDVQASSIEACAAMMELAFGHGEEYYSQLRRKVIDYWVSRGVLITIPDWVAIDRRIYDN